MIGIQGHLLAQTAVGSLVIEKALVVDRHLVLAVRNSSPRRITAWGVRGRVTFDGSAEQMVEEVFDGYESGFYLSPDHKPVVFVPGATVTKRLSVRLRDSLVTSAALAPTAVVFGDGTATGQDGVIAFVFAQRARERRACEILETVLTRHVGTVADAFTAATLIERALDDAADDHIRDTRQYRSFRRNLAHAMELASANRVNLGERLRQMQLDIRSRRAIAEANYRRR